MPLPEADLQFLTTLGLQYDVTTEAAMTCVVLRSWPLLAGYATDSADLLVRLPAGYPDTAPDMWWFAPAVTLAGGGSPPATEVVETHLGRTWQRWSRHLQPGQWKSGIDGLQTYLALITTDVARHVPMVAR
jgi:Prokaryotic E2 family E